MLRGRSSAKTVCTNYLANCWQPGGHRGWEKVVLDQARRPPSSRDHFHFRSTSCRVRSVCRAHRSATPQCCGFVLCFVVFGSWPASRHVTRDGGGSRVICAPLGGQVKKTQNRVLPSFSFEQQQRTEPNRDPLLLLLLLLLLHC